MTLWSPHKSYIHTEIPAIPVPGESIRPPSPLLDSRFPLCLSIIKYTYIIVYNMLLPHPSPVLPRTSGEPAWTQVWTQTKRDDTQREVTAGAALLSKSLIFMDTE